MIKEYVGKRIKLFRTNQGLSQEKLAFLSGLDRTYLASVEAGKRNISIVNLEKIINALDISFATFFEEK